MTQISQGSITIHRLRRGYTLTMHFLNLTSIPLYQGVDSAGNVSPSWSNPTGNASDSDTVKDASRPQLQPVVECSTGLAVTIRTGSWYYLGTQLTFDSTGKCTNAASGSLDFSNTFKLSTDGKYILTIIGDLAIKDVNEANDLLTFTCTAATARSEEQELTGNVTIVISPVGTGSYNGIVGYSSQTIAAGDDGIDVTLSLLYGGTFCTSFKYAIVKAGTSPTATDMKTVSNKSSLTISNAITPDMVSGQTTFLVYFYTSSETDPNNPVDTDGFAILDNNDEYKVDYAYDDVTKTQIGDDDDDTVPLTARIVSISTGQVVTTTSADYTHNIYSGSDESSTGEEASGDWVLRRTVTGTNKVVLSNSDSDYSTTDSDGNTVTVVSDVTVVGSCTFEI